MINKRLRDQSLQRIQLLGSFQFLDWRYNLFKEHSLQKKRKDRFSYYSKSLLLLLPDDCSNIGSIQNYFAGVIVIFSAAVVFVILPGVVLVGNSDILVLLEELE
jgi:hypothetical protein